MIFVPCQRYEYDFIPRISDLKNRSELWKTNTGYGRTVLINERDGTVIFQTEAGKNRRVHPIALRRNRFKKYAHFDKVVIGDDGSVLLYEESKTWNTNVWVYDAQTEVVHQGFFEDVKPKNLPVIFLPAADRGFMLCVLSAGCIVVHMPWMPSGPKKRSAVQWSLASLVSYPPFELEMCSKLDKLDLVYRVASRAFSFKSFYKMKLWTVSLPMTLLRWTWIVKVMSTQRGH